jgi:energy-coupling factor transporter ATP-binding protein EcfA2
MTDETSADILEWSKGRPAWQRDALRQLFVGGDIASAEIDELVELCKSAHGLATPRSATPLSKDHIRASTGSAGAVSLRGVTHHVGVNALAADQTVVFGPALTVVYGQNAAGKSGYTRILKHACRSRSPESILGNVISGAKPLKAQATINFREGAVDALYKWHPDLVSPPALTTVSVFDTHSAGVYLREKTDVAFRPFGLDIFDKLSRACGEVRIKLEAERAKLLGTQSGLPLLSEGTVAKSIVDGLNSLTNIANVQKIATLSEAETKRLAELRAQERDALAADPKQRARDLALKGQRIGGLATHLTSISRAVGAEAVRDLRESAEALGVAQSALSTLRATALTAELLPGTGGREWKSMWDAVRTFARIAFPGKLFPNVADEATCPFCQQRIEDDAASRLTHLLEYVSSNAQVEVDRADAVFRGRLAGIANASISKPDMEIVRTEVSAEEPALGQEVLDFISALHLSQRAALEAVEKAQAIPAASEIPNPAVKLVTMSEALRQRADQLQAGTPGMSAESAQELRELEARVRLHESLPAVEGEVERKKRIAVYGQCIDETNTLAITRKSTELTRKLVTDRLQNAFRDELTELEFTHLQVEIQTAGGAKGEMFHKLVFANAPNVGMTAVLSEGESRTLSLAAFLMELSTAPSASSIIFDDPVSSLDHVWRERIANRLIEEAKKRQVIVFTHDLLFLKLLKDGSEQKSVECSHQYVRRNDALGAGVCSSELPWVAMGVRERIGVLRNRWQEADKLFRTETQDAYEKDARDVYGLVREAWEQGVAEILLADVVGRYRPSVETKKVRHLHDITQDDCKVVDDEMTECSRWIRGHDQAAADGTPFPKPSGLKERIDALEEWTKRIKKRRG